ncbi:MAG: beta strand repeat-containing protein, partial [Janthinobacterium lividum]
MPAFKQGDVVVYRVGTGSAALTSAATAVFLDEYSPTGTLVQSIALPTAIVGSNQALTASGTAGSEGLVNLSADGHYLVLTGYDAAAGLAGVAATATTGAGATPRTIGRVDATGAIDTTTTTTAFSGNNIRSATSADGSSFYADGAATGVVLQPFGGSGTGTLVSSTVVNDRSIEEFGGNLYFSTGAGTARGIYEVGTGLPTATGTVSTIQIPTGGTSSPYQFYLADLSSSVAGYDTAYVIDSTAGLQKYTLSGTTWTLNNSVALTGGTGLTGSVDAQGVHLFVTSPTTLYSLTDVAGYGVNDSGTATTIATAATNEAFRGVAFAPTAAVVAPTPTIYVSSGAVSHPEGNSGTTAYTFTLTRDSGTADATVHFAVAGSGANPADATDFGGTLPSGAATFAGTGLTTTVTVAVTGDTTVEPDEQFTVTLSAPSAGYVLGTPASQTGTIQNDDAATDTTPPTLAAAAPANGMADVAIGANVVLTFSEAVKAGTGNIVLHPEDGSANVTIAVGDTTQVTFAGSQVTINPSADLRPGVQYAVVIASGVVTDTAGNAFGGVAQESLDFTTSSTIPAGSAATPFTIQDAGSFTLAAGATRTQTAGVGVAVTSTAGPVAVDIEGTLTDTASGQRAINYANNPIPGTITVGTAGSVQSLNTDAIRVQSANGTINLNNQGQIIAGATPFTPAAGGTNPGTGFAVTYNAALGAAGAPATDYTSGGTITNGSAANTAALIRADNGDAIRLGSHETLVNYGTINGNGPVNDASTNNAMATNGNTSVATTYDISRGVRINQAGATAVDIENHGTITGAQHGLDTGVVDATNIVVDNFAGASIIGRSGSGVGSDTTGAAATTYTVNNHGLIEGDSHPQYDRAGYATTDSDGDGVDIDGGGTITNFAGGQILATGASGYDSNGHANQSEGISIGGGVIVNAGTIQGAGAGIIVNNDSNTDATRSGGTATTITNDATGTITGLATYAIRLENKTGTAADNDTIVNYGTITGNGTVPTGTVLLENGMADPSTVGTLNGMTYTAAANAGSARFIQGDGAAIQMGEGADTLANYGAIVGKSGLAISLEGGNDTLTLHTGSSVTGTIDGGVGTDTLILALDDRPAMAGGDAGNNGGVTTGTLAQVTNFEALDVQGGAWTIADAQGYAGVTVENGATLLLGTGAQLSGAIALAGHLTVATTGAISLDGAITGAGVVEQAGSGTLTLTNAANGYSGGTLLTAGTLDVAVAGAAGTGAITFGTGAATLHVETAAIGGGAFANAITGFAADGDVIDAAGIGLATASYNAGTGVLTLTSATIEAFTIGTGYGNYVFTTAADGATGTEAGTAVTLTSTAPASLSIADASVTEGNAGTSSLVFTVTSSVAAPAAGLSFHIDTADGTATVADSDYVALHDVVATIAPGQTSTTVAVTVNGDTRFEPDETLTATISQPGGTATIAHAQATGSIVNDDPAPPPPTLSISDAHIAEGDAGQTMLTFTVTASAAAPTGGIGFTVATADGTATAGSDYVAQSTTGTIAAGATSTSFTVLVNGDTTYERDETVLVNLTNPTNATIAHGQGIGTIENDDPAPATAQLFSTDFASFTAAGFAPGATAASGMLDSNVWRVAGLSDNTNPAYGFTGPAGGDFGRGVINGSADPVTAGVYSPSANHALVIQPTGAELDANGTVEARIQNTSGATATSFDVAFDWAYRNSGGRADNLQLAYSTDGTNFTPVSAAGFTTPGTQDATVAATFADQHEAVSINGTVADGGYLYLRWIHASSTGGGSRDEVGIDNVGVTAHLSSTPTASVGDISIGEGNAGTTAATFTVARSNGAGTASVDYATADGTAVAGSDYVAQKGTVTFAAGETSKTVTVLVNGDTQHEANETFTLNLSNPVGFQVPQTTATATIVNDDTGPVAIYDIQGLGHHSPFTGQSVSTSGVVTAVKT